MFQMQHPGVWSLVWIVTIVATQPPQEAYSYEVLGSPFAITDKIGNFFLTEGFLLVPLSLKSPNVETLLEKARFLLNETLRLRDFDSKLFDDSINTRIQLVADFLDHHEANNVLFITKRKKRGFLDIGGKLLQVVFGVATNDDVNSVINNFNNMSERILTSEQNIEVTTTVLRNSMLKLTDMLKSANSLTKSSLSAIRTKMQISERLNIIENAINVANIILLHFNALITEVRQGHVEKIFNENTLIHFMIEGRYKFPNAKFPIKITNATVFEANSFLVVRKTKLPYKFLIKIPFVGKTMYKLHEVTYIPSTINHNRFILTNGKRFVGVSQNEDKYFLTDSIKSCNKIFCSDNFEIYNKNHKTCTRQILESVQTDSKLCKFEKIFNNNVFFVKKMIKYWAVVFYKNYDFSIKCYQNHSVVTTRHSNTKGIFKIPNSCDLKSHEMFLSTKHEENSAIELIHNTTVGELKFPQWDDSDIDLQALDRLQVNLDEIQNNLNKNLSLLTLENADFRKFTTIHVGIGYLIACVAIIMVIVGIIIAGVKIRRNRVKKERKIIESFNLKTLKQGTL